MDYQLSCECGHLLRVFASNCGEHVTCPQCDKEIVVPLLSELRRQAGVAPVDVATKLRLMNLDKRLPVEDCCIECGHATDNQPYCQVECERVYTKKRGYLSYVFATMLLLFSFWMWWIFVMMRRDYLNPEIEGTDLAVDAPIRICPQCFSAKAMNRARRVALLRKTPDYGRLLDHYPDAGITTAKKLSNKSPARVQRSGV